MTTEESIRALAEELGYTLIQQVGVDVTSYRMNGNNREVVVAYDTRGRIIDAVCFGQAGEKESTVERWMHGKRSLVEAMIFWAADR